MTDALQTAFAMPARLSRPLHRALEDVVPPLLFLAGLLALWAVGSAAGWIPAFLLPSPFAVGAEFINNAEVLFRHGSTTTLEAVTGFLIGNGAAVLASAVLSSSRTLRDMFYPYALVSRAIPIVVFTPVVVVMLGRGLPPIIAVVSFSVYFPTFLNLMRGFKAADADQHELLHTLSATRLQRLLMIEFPAAMPYLFTGLKVSASTAFITALVTEWIGADTGLGYLVIVSGQYFKLATLWAAIFISAALTLTLLGLVHLAEHALKRFTATSPEMGQ